MKSCPTCQRVFPDNSGFCPFDGARLTSASLAPPAPSGDPLIGTVLGGNYEVRRLVADGGMGRVYQGIDRARKDRVAIKVLHPDVAKDEVARARFQREFEISASLPHDHIIEVYDFQQDQERGMWFLSMEFLEGEELRSHLERDTTIKPARLVRLLSQMAIGLDEAHRRSFVHRDLKPENVFLCGTREGDHVKVLDFGSVRVNKGDVKKLTAMGTTIGTAYYMAPEQASGSQSLDGRADVFACGCMAYECLTGRRPFDGPNGPQVLMSILMNDPELPGAVMAKKGVEIPPGVDDAVERALAKKPDIRTKTVGAFATDIGRGFGLEGDFQEWAKTPLADLEARVTAAHAKAMAGSPAPQSVGHAMDAAFREEPAAAPAQRIEWPTEEAPKAAGRPGWVVPAIVALSVVALAVAGCVLTR
jgi:serine/threonine protein kinase